MILFNVSKFLYKCACLLKENEDKILVRNLYNDYISTSINIIYSILKTNPRVFSKLTRIICQQENIKLKRTIPWTMNINKSTRERIINEHSSNVKDDIVIHYGIHYNKNFYTKTITKEYIPLTSNLEEQKMILEFCIPRDTQAVISFKKSQKNDGEDLVYYIYCIYPFLRNDKNKLVKSQECKSEQKDEDIDYEMHGKWHRDLGRADDIYRRQEYIPEWDEDGESPIDKGYMDDYDYDE